MQKKNGWLSIVIIAALLIVAGIVLISLRGAPAPSKKVTGETVTGEVKALPKVITLYQKGEGESDLAAFVARELAKGSKSLANFGAVNVLDEPQMAGFFGVSSMPAIIFVRPNGKVYRKYSGYLDKSKIVAVLRTMGGD